MFEGVRRVSLSKTTEILIKKKYKFLLHIRIKGKILNYLSSSRDPYFLFCSASQTSCRAACCISSFDDDCEMESRKHGWIKTTRLKM
jgi:hypothetical protein